METKLNLGCGPHPIDGWLNIDLIDHPKVKKHDLSVGLSFVKTETIEYIFSEHFIEHVTKEQGRVLLRDCYRVLKKNGVIRLSTPDLNMVIKRYILGKDFTIPGVWEPSTPCEFLNQGLRLWGHSYVYDYPELKNLLEECGFENVRLCDIRTSNHKELNNREVRPLHFEMCIEAIK